MDFLFLYFVLFLVVLAFLGKNKGIVTSVWGRLVGWVSWVLKRCVWILLWVKDWFIILFGGLILVIFFRSEKKK